MAAQNHRWRQENRERWAAYQRRWQQENQEKVNARSRHWKQRNPEKVRASGQCYKEENRAKILAYGRIYSRRYRQENPEKAKMAHQRHRQKYPERHAALEACRLARKRNLPHTLTVKQREQKLSIGYCFYCGRQLELELDHFIPLAAEKNSACGTTLANSVAACRRCNSSKGTKLPRELLAQLSFTEARLEALNLGPRDESLSG